MNANERSIQEDDYMYRKHVFPILIIIMVMAVSGCQPVQELPREEIASETVLDPGDKPDLHGMLIVGEQTVFLSHLPLFDHPHHDFQVILEVTFTKPGSDPHAIYVNDRQTHRETTVYTLVPEEFVLPDLVINTSESGPFPSFRATIVRGHFEKGGQPIIEDVQVDVANVVHFRQFDPNAEALPQLDYLLFGKGDELFLAHLITKPPDFDQIVSVQGLSFSLAEEALRQGLRITLPDRTNTVQDRITGAEPAEGRNSLPIRELYFEEGELSLPPTFSQTEAEKAAGF